MESSRSNINQWLSRILLIAIIATSSIVMYAINEIDKIINGNQVGQLYYYSLQFSLDWANPYWGFTQIIYISLGATIIMSTVVLLLEFIKTKKTTHPLPSLKSSQKFIQTTPLPIVSKTQPTSKPPEVTIIQHKPEPATSQKPITAKPVEIKTKTTNKTAATAVTTTETAQTNSTCPSCKKGFSQPLVMLDFEGGKSKLVNVCPYCNQVLGDTERKIEE